MGRGYVIRIETLEMHTKFWQENPKVRHNSKDLGVDGKIILEWNLGKENGMV
jgi:hypothetical protein